MCCLEGDTGGRGGDRSTTRDQSISSGNHSQPSTPLRNFQLANVIRRPVLDGPGPVGPLLQVAACTLSASQPQGIGCSTGCRSHQRQIPMRAALGQTSLTAIGANDQQNAQQQQLFSGPKWFPGHGWNAAVCSDTNNHRVLVSVHFPKTTQRRPASCSARLLRPRWQTPAASISPVSISPELWPSQGTALQLQIPGTTACCCGTRPLA